MVQSMTGFGRGEAPYGAGRVAVEVSAVNGRYLDVTVRGLREHGALELAARGRVGERLSRGSVNLTVSFGDGAPQAPNVSVNLELARAYERAFDQLRAALGLKGSLPLEALTGRDDFLVIAEAPGDEGALTAAFMAALDEALEGVAAMRASEGARLAAEISAKAGRLNALYDKIAERAPAAAAAYRERLRARVAELAPGAPCDETRLEAEVALFADRCDITEEISRSRTHAAALLEALREEGRVGRRLDFLLVELNREANTMAAKAQDVVVAAVTIDVKDLLEQMREQVQNFL